MHDPENVHLVRHELRLCAGQQQVKERLRSIRLKLVTVRVIEKLDPVLRERLARLVENLGRLAADLRVRIAVRARGDRRSLEQGAAESDCAKNRRDRAGARGSAHGFFFN